MNLITDAALCRRYRQRLDEAMNREERFRFDPTWIRARGWVAAPVESAARLAPEHIPHFVHVLRGLPINRAVVLMNEDELDAPVFDIEISASDFLEINSRLGLYRFVITDEFATFGIACTEWYNLIAGNRRLVEQLLDKSAASAFREFQTFARGINAESLVDMASEYADAH